jgi:hypothetical protein
LLPKATEPWRIAILRRHEPVGSPPFKGFRACLRWEFGFSCAFCLLHESDLSEHGTEGWGLMWIEHGTLRSQAPELANDYENCFYSCRFCNQARSSRPHIDEQQRRLLNPCEVSWQEHFDLDGVMIRVRGDHADATYTHETYDLNDPRKVRMRGRRRKTLSEMLAVISETKPLHDRLLQRALDTGDSTFVDDARIAWDNFRYACEDLLRFLPIPEDASRRCSCGHTQHHSLPEVLEEQLILVDANGLSWRGA